MKTDPFCRPCPRCGADHHRLRYHEPPFQVVRCRVCRLVYLGNPPDDAELYEAYHGGAEPAPSDYRADSTKQNLATAFAINAQRIAHLQTLQPTGTLLDIGCGRGYFLRTAHAAGYDVQGQEVSANAARYATEKMGLSVSVGSVAELAATGQTFDVVTLWHVLEHFLDPFAALQAVRALLQPGGWCVLEVPNLYSLKFVLARQKWEGGNHPLYHRTFFSAATLHRALQEAGFSAIRRVPLSYRVPGQSAAYTFTKRVLNSGAMDAFLTYQARR